MIPVSRKKNSVNIHWVKIMEYRNAVSNLIEINGYRIIGPQNMQACPVLPFSPSNARHKA